MEIIEWILVISAFKCIFFKSMISSAFHQMFNLISQDRGIDGSIFQTPSKLHLTLGTLVLLTESDVIRAAELLGECKQDLTQ